MKSAAVVRAVVGIVASALMVSAAHSDTKVRAGANHTKVTYTWSFPPLANPESPLNYAANSGTFSAPIIVRARPASGDHVILSGESVAGDEFSYALAIGNSLAGDLSVGKLGTLATRADTAFAKDSIRIQVTRFGTDSLRLSNLRGEIRNNPGPNREVITNTVIVAVYPDTNAANLDVTNSGNGAVFYGRVILNDAGATITGGLASGDSSGFQRPWFRTGVRNSDGSVSLVPASGISKTIAVNGATAAVVIVSDPWSHRGPAASAPGLNPFATLVLSALLLASGLWFVNTRRSRSAA